MVQRVSQANPFSFEFSSIGLETLWGRVQENLQILKAFAANIFQNEIPAALVLNEQDQKTEIKTRKVVIIGSGPAGYTAAIYAARANLEPVVYEGTSVRSKSQGNPGGQLMSTTELENYPGFPSGVNAHEFVADLRRQALRFGATLLDDDVLEVDLKSYPFQVKGSKQSNTALTVIVATGARGNYPDIPGTREGEFWQKGVSSCAVCDGALPLFRNRNVYVIGGGDSAAEEALYLSRFASKVFIVHRRDTLRASKIMQQRVFSNPKIEVIWNSAISKVEGDRTVKSVVVKNLNTNQEAVHEAGGVFFATGHLPNTSFLKGQLALDEVGYIKVVPGTTKTSIPRVFAAGDVQDSMYRQAITAAASGCMAAIDAERALQEVGYGC